MQWTLRAGQIPIRAKYDCWTICESEPAELLTPELVSVAPRPSKARRPASFLDGVGAVPRSPGARFQAVSPRSKGLIKHVEFHA